MPPPELKSTNPSVLSAPQDESAEQVGLFPEEEIAGCDSLFKQLITKGIRENGNKIFNLHFYGRDWYKVREVLRRIAEHSDCYEEIRPLVLFENEIAKQLRSQGF